MLRVRGLGVEAAEGWPVWDVSFAVPAGAIAGITGPQGAGKSTLLRLLAGLVPASQGQAFLGEVDLVREPAWARRRTGYVADSHGFYPEMAVAEYLAFMAACHGVPAADRASLLADLLEVVDLSAVRGAPVGTLSRGMRQRLAVARALVHDPDLLLLDDPAAGLDPRSRLELYDLLRELRDMGKAVLLCTADSADLAGLATHVGIMNGGRLVAFGTRDEILARGRRTRLIEVRVAGDPEPVGEMLRGMPLVKAVSVEGPVLRVAYMGGDGTIQSVLAALVRTGTPVLGFGETRGGLEEALRQITEA